MTSHRDYDRAYRMNQHPALNGKDRVTALWYASDEKFAAAMAEMEAAIEASGIPLDLEAIEREAIMNRLGSLEWELRNPMRRHERERRDGLLAERKELEDRLAALDTALSAMQAEHNEGRVGDTSVTLDTVAALVCADIAASYAGSIREGSDQLQAVE